jgi:hypothetical protein
MRNKKRRLRLRFLYSGCVGVLVALVLTAIGTSRIVSPAVLLVLWPPSIAGITDPTTISDKIVVGVFEFGGNFILYGVIGTLIGLCFRGKPAPEGLGTQRSG